MYAITSTLLCSWRLFYARQIVFEAAVKKTANKIMFGWTHN